MIIKSSCYLQIRYNTEKVHMETSVEYRRKYLIRKTLSQLKRARVYRIIPTFKLFAVRLGLDTTSLFATCNTNNLIISKLLIKNSLYSIHRFFNKITNYFIITLLTVIHRSRICNFCGFCIRAINCYVQGAFTRIPIIRIIAITLRRKIRR